MKHLKKTTENFANQNLTNDDTRDIAIRCVDKLIEMGYVPDNMDSDDEDEFNVQDMIHNEINSALGMLDHEADEPEEFED